jgi:hypothetical protein
MGYSRENQRAMLEKSTALARRLRGLCPYPSQSRAARLVRADIRQFKKWEDGEAAANHANMAALEQAVADMERGGA